MLDSKGSPLFLQKRVGYKGKIFTVIKFRTMFLNSSIGNYKAPTRNDKRVTKIGYFLRKLSIDELPQLINVFLGDMSFIGPRPLPEAELELRFSYLLSNKKFSYKKLMLMFDQRKLTKPGITGPSQANGRSNLSIEKSIIYDSSYISNSSFFYDLKILFLTIINLLIIKGSN